MAHIWDRPLALDAKISHLETCWNFRRRFNPHHSKTDVEYERSNLYKEQHQLFFELKAYYVENRDELVKELPNASSPERAKNILDSLERCVTDDIERTLLADTDSMSI